MASDYIKIASGCSSNSVLYRFEDLEIYMAVQLRLCGSISRKINFRIHQKVCQEWENSCKWLASFEEGDIREQELSHVNFYP